MKMVHKHKSVSALLLPPLLVVGGFLAAPDRLLAQSPAVITMDQEPHHHLVLENDFVKIFNVEVPPGNSIVLHRHDGDTAAIAIGDQEVTVGAPGKPDVHQKNSDGQVRLQPSGYVHSTRVDGAAAYHTVAVEFLRPQTGSHNLCAALLVNQPLNCAAPGAVKNAMKDAPYREEPQFASDQTQIQLVRVRPHKTMAIPDSTEVRLIVALDPAAISAKSPGAPDQALRPGDFVWFDTNAASRVLKNNSAKDVRAVTIAFKR